METVKIRCKDIMVGDWVANRNGSPMQIVAVDEDNAYACEGKEERPWIFGDDEGYEPQPIEITNTLLGNNGWKEYGYLDSYYSTCGFCCRDEDGYHLVWKLGTLSVGYNYQKHNDEPYFEGDIPAKYVHELLHALRLVGFNELADNFKI